MIAKTVTTTWKDYFRYIFVGADPRDIWEFDVHGLRCKVVNGWRSGVKLIINDVIVDQTNKLFSVGGTRPLLSASALVKIKESQGMNRMQSIFTLALSCLQLEVLHLYCKLKRKKSMMNDSQIGIRLLMSLSSKF